jgi:hypothetical protein
MLSTFSRPGHSRPRVADAEAPTRSKGGIVSSLYGGNTARLKLSSFGAERPENGNTACVDMSESIG